MSYRSSWDQVHPVESRQERVKVGDGQSLEAKCSLISLCTLVHPVLAMAHQQTRFVKNFDKVIPKPLFSARAIGFVVEILHAEAGTSEFCVKIFQRVCKVCVLPRRCKHFHSYRSWYFVLGPSNRAGND